MSTSPTTSVLTVLTWTSLLAIALYRRRSVPQVIRNSPGTVYLLGAGPGQGDLMSKRGWDLLERADVVLNDRLVDKRIVQKAMESGAKIVNVGKGSEKNRFAQADLEKELVKQAFEVGPSGVVVRLKGGDPYVFGLGGSEALALEKANVRWEYVPGISSAMALPGLIDVPLTHKGTSNGFIVVSGHAVPDGDDPNSEWNQLPRAAEPILTLVVVMCAKNLGAIADHLMNRLGWSPRLGAAVVLSGFTSEQKSLKSTLGQIAQDAKAYDIDKPPLTLIVGKACDAIKRDTPDAALSASSWGLARAPIAKSENNNPAETDKDEFWIFGYGSLMWRPSDDLSYVDVQDGYVTGYHRRFWQQSPDHRGTTDRPGRVVTMVPRAQIERLDPTSIESPDLHLEKVFGKAYMVDPREKSQVLAKLRYRERAGFEEHQVDVMCRDGRKVRAVAFVAPHDNENFVGPEPVDAIATRMLESIGASGPNIEYFEQLKCALEEMAQRYGVSNEVVVDAHILSLHIAVGRVRPSST